jgi:hypothetical protein
MVKRRYFHLGIEIREMWFIDYNILVYPTLGIFPHDLLDLDVNTLPIHGLLRDSSSFSIEIPWLSIEFDPRLTCIPA